MCGRWALKCVILAAAACAVSCWGDRNSSIEAAQKIKSWLSSQDPADEQKLQALFREWKVNYSRTYTEGSEEHTQKYARFKQGLARIVAVNLSPSSTWWARPNQYADFLYAEFLKLFLGANPPNNLPDGDQLAADGGPPPSVNWTASGKVSPVKDQGQCGACWAFSATGALESKYLIEHNLTWILSEQQLVDCTTSPAYPQCQGCNGGWSTDAFVYVFRNNVTQTALYPYTAADGACNQALLAGTVTGDVANIVDSPSFLPIARQSATALMRAVARQPTSVAFYVDEDFKHYSGGIYPAAGCTDNTVNHMVLATGYSSPGGPGSPGAYWEMKNSWSTNWGEEGYFRIEMMADKTNGACGMYLFGGFLPNNVSDQAPATIGNSAIGPGAVGLVLGVSLLLGSLLVW